MTDESSHRHPAKRNLGRGLAALFGEDEGVTAERDRPAAVHSLPVGQLRPGPVQPRRNFDDEALQALVQSVREKGVLQPLLVRRAAGGAASYEIIAGERRWRAAQLAKLHEVPVWCGKWTMPRRSGRRWWKTSGARTWARWRRRKAIGG